MTQPAAPREPPLDVVIDVTPFKGGRAPLGMSHQSTPPRAGGVSRIHRKGDTVRDTPTQPWLQLLDPLPTIDHRPDSGAGRRS